jgi:hypothetical protein
MRTLKVNAGVPIAIVVVAAMGAALAACGAGSSNTPRRDAGDIGDGTIADGSALFADGGGAFVDGSLGDAGGAGQGAGDASLLPDVFTGNGSCLRLGGACSRGGECCSGDCTSGACSYPACTSDTQACTSNGNCCSQRCTGGMCAALNSTCKTLGNRCASGAECCSQLCTGGSCQPSSFCGQPGDACSMDADCCTGACTKPAGQALGACAASSPGGPANCGLVDGQLCGGSATDGGILRSDAGLPACGGPCCSRACAPWGPTGVLICQPVSGCHVVGDLCMHDGDCCGSTGLPGGSHKPVTCVITPPNPVGVCRNPMGCKPDGDVCKLKTTSCNASCDCCSGNCETKDTCKQDNVGVPRCAPAQCAGAGAACASSASCCGGAPCVPNPVAGASPPYVCSGTLCVPSCGQCTNNADCCPGTSCSIAPGATNGICGPCGGGGADAGPAPDGGSPGPNGDGGGSGSGSNGRCSLYGQVCQVSADCCNGVPCTAGRCDILQ